VSDNLNIEKLFQDKLGNFESPVSPDVWANISSSIGSAAGTAAVQTGMSGLMKSLLIGGGIAAAGLVTTYIVISDDADPKTDNKEIPVMADENGETAEVDVLNFEQEGDRVIEENRESIEAELKVAEIPVEVFTMEFVEQILIDIQESETEDINLENIVSEATEDVGAETQNDAANGANDGVADVEDGQEDPNQEADEMQVISEAISQSAVVINCCFNVFTPNNDRINDVWPVRFENAEKIYIQIVDKDNNTVVVSTDEAFDWDGNDISGNELTSGYYYYFIVATDVDGNPTEQRGVINLKR